MLAEIAMNEKEREKLQGANYRRNLYSRLPFFHAHPSLTSSSISCPLFVFWARENLMQQMTINDDDVVPFGLKDDSLSFSFLKF